MSPLPAISRSALVDLHHRQRLPLHAIAARYGCTIYAVRERMRQLGVSAYGGSLSHQPKWADDLDLPIIDCLWCPDTVTSCDGCINNTQGAN